MSTQVNIAQFKAKMGRFLRLVKSGREVILKDHNLEVAKIIPMCEDPEKTKAGVRIVKALKTVEDFVRLKSRGPKDIDSLQILQELREDRF